MHANLTTKLILEEVKTVVFSFHPLKSLGADGLHPLFFQTQWHTIKLILHELLITVFDTCKIPPNMNHTLITLIPKIEHADNITHFRPIGLCNTIYKIVTKIIVNKIKPLMEELIGPHQAASYPIEEQLIT